MGKEKVLLYNYYCDVALYFAKYVRSFCVQLWRMAILWNAKQFGGTVHK